MSDQGKPKRPRPRALSARQAEVLEVLRAEYDAAGQPVSVAVLAARLGVSRGRVWDFSVLLLRKGYAQQADGGLVPVEREMVLHETLRERVCRTLARQGPMPVIMIAGALDQPIRVVSAICSMLLKDNLVERPKRGVYALKRRLRAA